MIINEREIDTNKDMRSIEDLDELQDYLTALFCEIFKHHPKYPEYGYTYENGKIVEYKRTQIGVLA